MSDEDAAELVARERGKVDAVFRRASRAFRPPPRLSLSQWADQHFVLSAESAAEPGRWKTLPYQRGIMDAITDRSVEQVTVMKSARVGWTKILNAAVGYYIHQDPAPILVVQPALDDAKGYSKEEIVPMLRDVPVLVGLVAEPRAKDSSNTILHKIFPGGSLSVVGANSGRGFRRVSRKVIGCDEIDAYPASAGNDGDPVELAFKRSETYWDRKHLVGSTPLIAGASRIETMYLAGDRRRYYVPCPSCGHRDILVFSRDSSERGHYMQWPEGKPEDAHFVCRRSGCVIEHRHKREMVTAGEWRSEAPFRGHASFHIWAAYSFSPGATWEAIARRFLKANEEGPEKLRIFVNTDLGETWKEKGEAPDWMRLYTRRERYQLGTVLAPVILVTAGVDVQRDRLVYEVVGWGEDKQSWTVDAGVFHGDTATEDMPVWRELDGLLERDFPREDRGTERIAVMAVDSGDNTNTVYCWGRGHPRNRVLATKGVATQRMLISQPTKVDVSVRGRRLARGYRMWPIGVNVAKSELYGWLRLDPPTQPGQPFPRGYCHHPELGEEYFKELTAEQLVEQVNKKTRFRTHQWQRLPGRENHFLDARVLARAAAAFAGLDQLRRPRRVVPPAPSADRLQQYVQYIRNTGRVPLPVALFDSDWEPIGPRVRADLVAAGLVRETPEGLALLAQAAAPPRAPPPAAAPATVAPAPPAPPTSPPRPRPKGWLAGGGRLGGGPRGGNWLGRRRR